MQGATSFANNTNFNPDQSSNETLYIGCRDGEAFFFDGYIDELRISLGQRYTESFTPPAMNLTTDGSTIALYHFDEGQGDTIVDSSGNGHHGTWIGTPAWNLGSPVEGTCDDGNPCTADSCGEDGNCDNEITSNGTACGDVCCSAGWVCQSDSCVAPPPPTGLLYTNIFDNTIYHWTPESGSVVIGTCQQPKSLLYVPPDTIYATCIQSDSIERFSFAGEKTTLYTSNDVFFNPRDPVLGSDGKIYFAASALDEDRVWVLDPLVDTVGPYNDIGVSAPRGIGFGEDDAFFYADIAGGGTVIKAPDFLNWNGESTTIISDFPEGYDLRQMHLATDGKLYIVGAMAEAGLRVYDQDGTLLEQLPIPSSAYTVHHSPSGETYILTQDDSPAIYRRNGDGWEFILEHDTGVGSIYALE
jgi:sugar lactone lactonase YvrE